MPNRRHREEQVAVAEPQHGHLEHVIPSWHNHRCALVYESQELGRVFVHDGRVCSEDRGIGHRNQWSLSFDGRKLATTQMVSGHGCRWRYEVRVNGEPIWTGPDEFYVYDMQWLPGGRLVWRGWFDMDSERNTERRTYEDGREVGDRLQFETVGGERGRHDVMVKENGETYTVGDNGTVRNRRESPCDCHLTMCHCDRDWWERPRPEMPEKFVDEESRAVRVRYLGRQGPAFHDIESGGGFRTFALSEDREHHAYIGIRYAEWARHGQGMLGRIISSYERGGLLGKALILPAAVLGNPYLGPLHLAGKASRRWYPVLDQHEWSRGYRYANDHFITPDTELALTAYGLSGPCVVIDEDEGPTFDKIMNVRHIPGEGICYMAQRGDTILRVVAS